MAHRADQKKAAREARLRREAELARTDARRKRIRTSGYGIIGLIAAALIAFAVLSGGSANSAATKMGDMGGSAAGPAIGAMAPNFMATDAVSGKPFTLASLRGQKTLLFFSEGVGCQACMIQAGDLQKDTTLRKDGIRLVSVTTDQIGDLQAAAEQYGITTPLLSDPSTEFSKSYGMLGHGGMQHPTQDGHAFMLLSPSGKVLWHQAYQDMYVKTSQLLSDMGANA
jgi:peroxiredoxin Q/BCP